MTESTEVELKLVPYTLQTMQLVITWLQICVIGILLHTSAKICVWNTNVHFA